MQEAFKASEKERLNLSSQLHDVCKSHSSLVDELSGISAMNSTLQGELWGTRHQVEDLSRQIQLLEQSVIDLQMEVCKMTVEVSKR